MRYQILKPDFGGKVSFFNGMFSKPIQERIVSIIFFGGPLLLLSVISGSLYVLDEIRPLYRGISHLYQTCGQFVEEKRQGYFSLVYDKIINIGNQNVSGLSG